MHPWTMDSNTLQRWILPFLVILLTCLANTCLTQLKGKVVLALGNENYH